jgi:hypothetical protein
VDAEPELARTLSAWFSLHANTHVPAHRRDQLERLMRYTARGSVSLARLGQDETDDLISTFSRPWSDSRPWADGRIGIKLSSLGLLEKLSARVPSPRVPQIQPPSPHRPPHLAARHLPYPVSPQARRCPPTDC